MKTVIVVPAYNEEQKIKSVLMSIQKKYTHIIVIDDGSTDDTWEQIMSVPGIIACRHIINRGQGAALRTGTHKAIECGADFIVHFDADGQMNASDINQAIDVLKTGEYDAVLGSRFLGVESNIPLLRRAVLTLARYFNTLFIGGNLTDPQSGFRVLTAKAAANIKISQDRMAHCSEIQHQLFKKGMRVKEIPVHIIYTEYSREKGQKSSNAFKIVWDLFIHRIIQK